MDKKLEDVHCYKMVIHLGCLSNDTAINGVVSEEYINELIKQGKLLEPAIVNFHYKDCPLIGTRKSHNTKETYRFLITNLNDLK